MGWSIRTGVPSDRDGGGATGGRRGGARMQSNVTDAETVVDETHPIIVGSVVGSSGRRPGLVCAAA